jgi:DNA helicase-2/ATP-dependent DNA helicase PcrA
MTRSPQLYGPDDSYRLHISDMASRIAYTEVLNPAQLAAATYGDGPLLVIAGAGSGKTRTLIYRVAKLVEEGVPPQAILLLSFTRKASEEMLRRAALLLDQRCDKVVGGTFHSFANTVLRHHAHKIGLSHHFGIIDRADSEALIAMIRRENIGIEDNWQLPRKSTLSTIFSRSINKAVSLEEIIYEDYPHFEGELEVIKVIQDAYQQRKRELDLCDYDDLLVYLHQLLSENRDVRRRLSSSFEYILVDEYQDTNLIQAQIIALLSESRHNVMVVGDDAQCIYAFRGANFANIMTFPERFPGTRIIKLEENYRSCQPILDLANAIIEPAREKYSKRLFTRRSDGCLPILVACANENAQSRYVVNEIFKLTAQGIRLDEIAVLFRAGFHSFDLELELQRNGIDFVKFGGFKFTDSAHIKDLLAHLKILHMPKDRLSWHRVLLLVDGVGPKTAQTICDAIIQQGQGAAGLAWISLKPKLDPALAPLKALLAALSGAPVSPVQMGATVLQYYLPILERRYDDHPRRLRDLEQLLTIMERYQNLEQFLTDMALEPPGTSIRGQLADADLPGLRLNLSTVHSAKGLEWHMVFIIWALDGRFPSRHAMDKPDALEEERRLLYVAATRARERLYITYPAPVFDRATQSYLYQPSRFLQGTADELVEKIYFR